MIGTLQKDMDMSLQPLKHASSTAHSSALPFHDMQEQVYDFRRLCKTTESVFSVVLCMNDDEKSHNKTMDNHNLQSLLYGI